MRILVLFATVCAVSLCMEDDDNITKDSPRVAWVPIVSRNVTATVGRVLEAERGSEEKLTRIGKMLEDSYDQMTRDVAEGESKMRELEQVNNDCPRSISSTSIIATIIYIFFRLF